MPKHKHKHNIFNNFKTEKLFSTIPVPLPGQQYNTEPINIIPPSIPRWSKTFINGKKIELPTQVNFYNPDTGEYRGTDNIPVDTPYANPYFPNINSLINYQYQNNISQNSNETQYYPIIVSDEDLSQKPVLDTNSPSTKFPNFQQTRYWNFIRNPKFPLSNEDYLLVDQNNKNFSGSGILLLEKNSNNSDDMTVLLVQSKTGYVEDMGGSIDTSVFTSPNPNILIQNANKELNEETQQLFNISRYTDNYIDIEDSDKTFYRCYIYIINYGRPALTIPIQNLYHNNRMLLKNKFFNNSDYNETKNLYRFNYGELCNAIKTNNNKVREITGFDFMLRGRTINLLNNICKTNMISRIFENSQYISYPNYNYGNVVTFTV